MPQNLGGGLYINYPRDLLTIQLLAQYYSTNTTRCSLWVPTFVSALRFLSTAMYRKEVDCFDLAVLFAFHRPVTENFNGNVEEIYCSSAAHYSK